MIFNQRNIEPKKTNKNSSKINKYLLNFFNNLLENGNSPPYYKGMQRGKIPIILLVWQESEYKFEYEKEDDKIVLTRLISIDEEE